LATELFRSPLPVSEITYCTTSHLHCPVEFSTVIQRLVFLITPFLTCCNACEVNVLSSLHTLIYTYLLICLLSCLLYVGVPSSRLMKQSPQPDVVSNSIVDEHMSSEIGRLEALCELRTKQLSALSATLQERMKWFEAVMVVARYYAEQV